ncbi:MAG: hypothetical protein LQ352_006243 [Teloschistes flavicans]|nr:MAG: hypothetical protein LQ352_006243 [Teloschistes flavicans]
MDDPPLTSFSVTHVSYDASDPVAYLCAWLALAPQILTVVYTTLIWSSREVEIMLMFAGQMGCEVLNFLLKRIIKGERPPSKIPILLSLLSLLFAASVCASRVYLSYHTRNQVLVGCAVGIVTAFIWFSVVTLARWTGWISWALDRREMTLLRIRDLVVEEDLAESGWERWRNVKKRRKAEKTDGVTKKQKIR